MRQSRRVRLPATDHSKTGAAERRIDTEDYQVFGGCGKSTRLNGGGHPRASTVEPRLYLFEILGGDSHGQSLRK